MSRGKGVPVVTRGDISRGLAAVGLAPGDGVLVHASLSSFGHVEGGADAVVDAVLDVLGPEGTAVFPTFTGDAVGAAILGVSGRAGLVTLPEVTDVNLDDLRNVNERHIDTGAVPKAARRRADFLKGTHPLYSIVAKGPLARELVALSDRYIFAAGKDKFIHRLGEHGGKSVLLGVGHASNSAVHVAAELAGVEYKVQDRAYWSLTVDEFLKMPRRRQAELVALHFGATLPYGVEPHYERIEPVLAEAKAIRFGRIGGAEVRLMVIADFIRVGLEALRRDPWLLADRVPRSP